MTNIIAHIAFATWLVGLVVLAIVARQPRAQGAHIPWYELFFWPITLALPLFFAIGLDLIGLWRFGYK